jgi:hypothetical protein
MLLFVRPCNIVLQQERKSVAQSVVKQDNWTHNLLELQSKYCQNNLQRRVIVGTKFVMRQGRSRHNTKHNKKLWEDLIVFKRLNLYGEANIHKLLITQIWD